MKTQEAICGGVTRYELDDESVLFLERSGQLLRLNPTAAFIWRGLETGFSFREIINSLSEVSNVPAAKVEQDVTGLIAGLREAGALDNQMPEPSASASSTLLTQSLPRIPMPRQTFSVAHDYRLANFRFRLRTPNSDIQMAVHRLLAHLSLPEGSFPDATVDIVENEQRWILVIDGELVDQCSTFDGIVPMLHANTLLKAYRTSGCMAGLHAASVIKGEQCILMPAESGSGKSTLTAALVAGGFEYGADDLTLLTHDPIRVKPVPTCLGLKPGSWNVVSSFLPEIIELPIHLRSDGKQVRYLPPPKAGDLNASHSYKARAIVFPQWTPISPSGLHRINSAEGLTRLTASGYDLLDHIDRTTVEVLIRWISSLPCYELQYAETSIAVHDISALLS